MMRGAARLNDKTFGKCKKHGTQTGKIISASPDTQWNDRGAARLNDKVIAKCGCSAKIVSASTDTIVNDRGAARLNDKVDGSNYKAIAKKNRIDNPNKIQVGKKLVI